MNPGRMFAVLAVCSSVAGLVACAVPEQACEQSWRAADANNDGVLVGPEEDHYIPYYRVRVSSAPIDGRITREQFVSACSYNILNQASIPAPR